MEDYEQEQTELAERLAEAEEELAESQEESLEVAKIHAAEASALAEETRELNSTMNTIKKAEIVNAGANVVTAWQTRKIRKEIEN